MAHSDTGALAVLTAYLLDGQQWMIHHGRYDMACLGRENSRPGAAARARLLAPAARLLASAVPERRDDLLTFASRLEHGAPPQVGAHG